jgi:hypothetical protein
MLQVYVKLQDRPKTALSAAYAHYESNRMPVGLKDGPSTFQRHVHLSGIQGLKYLVYLDDIIIFSENLKVHNDRLREVFARLRSYKLKRQIDKCEFLRNEVLYLGFRLTSKGLLPDESKLNAVKEFPIPNTTKKLKGFVGLAGNYRRSITKFQQDCQTLD